MFKLNLSQQGKEFMINFTAMLIIFGSGLIMALSYYIMVVIENAFKSVDCLIPQNTLVTTCQEWFNLALFPVLNLKYIFVFGNYFLIFGLVFGLFFLGFRSKKHPILFIVHILSSIIFGYLAIEMANIYRTLIANDIIYNILVPFPVYNKIMLYFPQFVFFVIFLSGIIGFMGVFRSAGQFNEGNEDLG